MHYKSLVGVLCSWQILARCLTSGEETSLLGDREGSSHLLKSTWVSWGHFCPDRWAKMWPCGRQQTALVLKMGLWSQFGGGYCSFPTRNTFKPFRSRPLVFSRVGLTFQWHASYLHFFILPLIFVQPAREAGKSCSKKKSAFAQIIKEGNVILGDFLG